VPRAIADLLTDDLGNIILIGGVVATAATELCTSGLGRRPGSAAKERFNAPRF
jgi:hypothetical protein